MGTRISPWSVVLAAVVPALLFPAQGCQPPNIPEDWAVTGLNECRDLEAATEEYYELEMKPFFDEYCFYCHKSDNEDRHGAPESKNFDTLTAARTSPSLTWARVSSFQMPPLGRLPSTGELDTLLDWLNCVSDPQLEVPEELGDCPDGATVTSADVDTVLASNCTRCHSAGLAEADRHGAPDGINWDTAADVTGFGDDAFIWSRVYTGEMPVDAAMNDEAALVLWEWLSCGSP